MFLHKSGCFRRIFSRKRCNMAKLYYLLTVSPSKKLRYTKIRILKKNEHHSDFWATLTWFFRFWLVVCPLFWWLLTWLPVKLVDPCLVISYDAFHECEIRIGAIQHVWRDLLTVLFLKKIQRFWKKPCNNASHAQNIHQNRMNKLMRNVKVTSYLS